ncbi:MAG: hypothetical protein ACR2II_08580 [Chthoniobacterales bacterium]
MITLIALSRLIPMKGNYRVMKSMNKTLAENTGRASRFPPGIGLTRHLISGVLCLAVISLICARASAQNLFAGTDFNIVEFTPNGVESTFASGFTAGLAFDKSGNLFVADDGSGAVYKFTPAGVRTTFASELPLTGPVGLAFDSAGNLFVAADVTIYKFTPTGARTTFATVQLGANGLAFDQAGNLFVAAGSGGIDGNVYKFTPTGVRTTFASGLYYPFALAFDSRGNLFVADGGFAYDLVFGAAVYKFTPSGLRSTVASENDQVRVIPNGLAIDGADNLFVADEVSGNILKFTPSGVRTTFAARWVGAMAFQPTSTSISLSRLLNISTRLQVGTGDNVLIGGFILQGTESKRVLIRALGPSLEAAGVSGALANPTLELHDSTGALIGQNNDWRTTQIGGVITDDQFLEIQSTGPPTSGAESAIIATLDPGAYTAIVAGADSTTGIGLAEVYDLEPAPAAAKLANISTRGFVQTDDNVMIGGFIVGNQTSQVLVLGRGPSLAAAGISNALADPMLELHDGNGALLASNDNWRDTQEAEISATLIAPSDEAESAILQPLAPGAYTAIVRGVNNTTGAALVEVYGLD